MFGLEIWTLLGILAVICLLISFAIGKNSIWGTFTLGIAICIIVAVVNLITGNGFNFPLLKKIIVVSVLIGGLFEFAGRIFKKR